MKTGQENSADGASKKETSEAEERELIAKTAREEAGKEAAEFAESGERIKEKARNIKDSASQEEINMEFSTLENEVEGHYKKLEQEIDSTAEKTATFSNEENPIPATEDAAAGTGNESAMAEEESARTESAQEAGDPRKDEDLNDPSVEEEDSAENLTEQELKDGAEVYEQVMSILFGGESQTGEQKQMAEAFKNLSEEVQREVLCDMVKKFEEDLGVQKDSEGQELTPEQKAKIIEEGGKAIEEKIVDGMKDPEDYKLDEEAFEKMKGQATKKDEEALRKSFEMKGQATGQYAAELGLAENYTKEELVEGEEQANKVLGINNEIDRENFQDKEKEFLRMVEEGEDLLAEDNPEKVNEYLLEMKDKIDNCSKRLKYIYLQIEADPDIRDTMKEQSMQLISAIQNFDEASKILKDLMLKVNQAQEEGEGGLTPEAKRDLSKILKILAAGAAFLAAIVYIGDKIAELVGAHTTVVGTGGIVAVTGTMGKMGAFSLGHGAGAAFADLLIKAYLLKIVLFDEEKRDRWVESIFAIKLPVWAKKPPKKGEKKDEKK